MADYLVPAPLCFGVALVVAFSPVGLIRPSRLAWVLPDASMVVAPAVPISFFNFILVELVSPASLFGVLTLVVSFCPVGLILPWRFASVLPLASFVLTSTAPAAFTSALVVGAAGAAVCAAAKAALANNVATVATIIDFMIFISSCLEKLPVGRKWQQFKYGLRDVVITCKNKI